MTDIERTILETYIRTRADELGLRDWTLFLDDEELNPEDRLARATLTWGRKHSKIAVCEMFRRLTPEQQRETIIHELVHLHFVSSIHVISDDLQECHCLPDTVHGLIYKAFEHQHEYAVDGLAEAIAPKFPLIEWQETSK
jgi:hypothetical protein